MCGRINVSDSEGVQALLAMLGIDLYRPDTLRTSSPHTWPNDIENQSTARQDDEWAFTPRWNVSPSAVLDALTLTENEELQPSNQPLNHTQLRWGIPAPWAEPGKSVRPLINARSETLFSKPTFKHLATKHRAVVPVNGFYEWERIGEERLPYHVQVRDLPAMLLAVVFEPASAKSLERENRTQQASPQMGFAFDEPTPTTRSDSGNTPTHNEVTFPNRPPQQYTGQFAVVTTLATGNMAQIHHRAPVMLGVEQAMVWLHENDQRTLESLLTPDANSPVTVTRVGTAVNSSRNDNPECIKPMV